jgi:DNA sulfur modification protein DndB
MANKTFIPAFEARVGDWTYFICIMKYAQVSREVQFAHELGGNKNLSTLIQRGISNRTEDIVRYLLASDNRFLGALIVATWGGAPEFKTLQLADPDDVLSGVDRGFGVLTLDGTHQFFALDGQHRLKAIKAAIKQRPELGAEDICVLLVSHYDSAEGREKTQRLFTNINRNARKTTAAEDIALDVDDGFAVVTRRLLTEHCWLSQDGVVRVFVKPPSENGEFTLATNNVPRTDKSAWTTLVVLHSLLQYLGFGLHRSMTDRSVRPGDQVLTEAYGILTGRLEELIQACGDVRDALDKVSSAADVRAPKGQEGLGHAFMRPVIQKAVVSVLQKLIAAERISWETALLRLKSLDWKLSGSGPWLAVFNTANGKMLSDKANAELLAQLIEVHLAPATKTDITKARKAFRDTRGANYPISQDELEELLEITPAPTS